MSDEPSLVMTASIICYFFDMCLLVLSASGAFGLGFPAHLEPLVHAACVLSGALRFLIYYYLLKKFF
jgi:arginine exporter protein ArgO